MASFITTLSSALSRTPICEYLEPRRLLSGYALNALANFGAPNGANPTGIVMDSTGNIFGVTTLGGMGNLGTVYEIPKGTNTIVTLADFSNTNGSPAQGLTIDSAGNLFGGLIGGGSAFDGGGIFELAKGSNTVTVLASFNGTNGMNPDAPPILDSMGNLYGSTGGGGANGLGVVFELPAGSSTIMTLADLTESGGAEASAGLTMDSAGNLYGSALVGGANSDGAVFELPKGASATTLLASFDGTNGSYPQSRLLLDSNGNLFGTTNSGGANGQGTIFEVPAGSGTVNVLADFDSSSHSPVIMDAAGDLFGTTFDGGTSSDGSVYELVKGSSTLTTLASFTGSNGAQPVDGLLMDSSGNFFGTAFNGGTFAGDVFELSPSAAGPATKLAFAASSATAAVGQTVTPALTVNVQDANDNIVTNDSSTVTLTLVSGPAGGQLMGSTTAVAVNGVASFSTLQFDQPGTYTLAANDGTLMPATFAITVTAPVLDASFGAATGGTVPIAFSAEQVSQEPDGKILVVGHQGMTSNNTSQGVLQQLNSDGTTDANFGAGGMVTTDIAGNDTFLSAAVESSGQIVAVGASNGSFLVARYNNDGTIDSTFGNGGFATAGFGADGLAVASSVAIAPDGKIVVGGEAGNIFAIAQFTATGALDTTFNAAGADDATFPSGGQRAVATGSAGAIQQIVIQGDGRILGVGAAGSAVAVFRLTPDGANDPSFGSGAIVQISQLSSLDPNSQSPVAESIALQPGGSLVVGGENPSGGFAATRLSPSGVLDPTFGSGGISTATFGGSNDDLTAIISDPSDGQFLLVGTTNAGGATQIAVAAFNPDGTANATFATNGQFFLPIPAVTPGALTPLFSPAPQPFAFHPQLSDFAFATFGADGKPLLGGASSNAASLARLNHFAPSQTSIGQFGHVGRKNIRLPAFTLADGTSVTITLAGGSGTAFHVGNQVQLNLAGATSVTIRTRGGSNSVTLADITSAGTLHALNAPTATLAGTLTAPGTMGTLKLARITGIVMAGGISNLSANSLSGAVSCTGVIATARLGSLTGTLAAAVVRNLIAVNVSGASILAGVNLGADGEIGGSGSAADSYGPGQIFSINVKGSITDSFFGAGVNPVDAIFGNGNDASAGPRSLIRSITVKGGVDSATRFESASLPKIVHLPARTLTAADSRFVIVS